MAESMPGADNKRPVKFVTLSDRRRLSYSEFGAPEGKPVLYCHGHPGSRLDPGLFKEEVLVQHGLRLIAPDRPGIGQSDFLAGRQIGDWPADVSGLMDNLGIQRFGVLGVSCGGPFAAVTAYKLPERVNRLALVSSVGRFDLPGATEGMGPGLMYFRMGRYLPWLARLQLRLMAYGVNSNSSKMAEQVKSSLPPPDLAAMEQPGMFDTFLGTMVEFLRQGPKGPAWEAGLFMRPWGFPLEEIRRPAFLWHGEADRNAPVAMGLELASRIPGCQSHFVTGEGHFSLAVNHAAEILGTLAD
jgi:pimeloyl-ACP methyl ester carboxylesterase